MSTQNQSEQNKHNLLYFESPSMRGLFDSMENWQNSNNKRLLSLSIQQDDGNFCCIALTNPTEVLIADLGGRYARMDSDDCLVVSNNSNRTRR